MDETTKHLKLADFGTSRMSVHSVKISKGAMSNNNFSAPEMLRNTGEPLKPDIYSLGLILHYMLTFEFPDEISGVIEGNFVIDPKYSADMLIMLKLVLKHKGADRPTIDKILEVQWIQDEILIIEDKDFQ